jgi:tetratricopeptide (TPR) repeat protein
MIPAMGTLVRLLALALALPLAGAGVLGLWVGLAEPRQPGEPRSLPAPPAFAQRGRALLGEGRPWSATFAGAGALAVAAGLAGWGISGLAGARRRSPARTASTSEAPPRSRAENRRIARRAETIASVDGPAAAGDFLLAHGLREEAAAVFARAELFDRLAEVRHDQNRFEECAEIYERAGRFAAAAAIHAQLGRFAEAARCYLRADKRSVAAEMFERAGSFVEAGRCYRETGFHRQAAAAFLRAGAESEAAESLVAVLREEGARGGAENETRLRELRALAEQAGTLLVKLRRLEEAESVLTRVELWGPAAKVAMQAGAFDRAADLFMRSGRGDLAAEALDRAGDVRGAARIRGEFLRTRGEDSAAVRYLYEAEEYRDAADLYRKLENFEQAAECYLLVKEYGAAAEMFEAADHPERASEAWEACDRFGRAAECAERAGDLGRQAMLLERGGLWYEAGRAYVGQQRIDDAIRTLQSVESESPRFHEACALLGELFRSKGMHSLSIAKYEQAVGGDTVSRANVDSYYALARQLEEREEHARAAEVFEKILAFDYHYSDVGARLERAKAAARRAGAEPVTSTLPRPPGGRYRVIRELGRGGMGVVYLARDTVLERDVAFKVLPEELRGNPNALRNFMREAKAAAQLNHPHIVTVYDVGDSEQGFYLAMEYIDGTTLKEILRRKGGLPVAGTIYVVRQIADALSFAHAKKVVHRDIKTANVMWTRDRQVKVMDFGLAKLMEEVRNATTLVSGTPFYMSPEQTLGRSVDHRTDLYSLGVTAFELATGTLPFRKGNVPYHHVHTPPPDPRAVNPRIPEALAALILHCLEKDPARRPQSAGDLLHDLDQIASSLPSA